MRTVSPLDTETLKGLLARYDVGCLLDHRPASHGIENSNHFITALKGSARSQWVLTILEQPSHSGSNYVPLLDLCHQAGLPVAPVVRNMSGDAIESLDGKAAMLAPMLPGHTSTILPCSNSKRLELHRPIPPCDQRSRIEVAPYPRDARWLRDRQSGVRGQMAQADARLVSDAVERVADLLRRKEVAALPAGLVHGTSFATTCFSMGRS